MNKTEDRALVWRVVLQLLTLFTMGGLMLLLHALHTMSKDIKPCAETPQHKATAELLGAQEEQRRLNQALMRARGKELEARAKLGKDAGP